MKIAVLVLGLLLVAVAFIFIGQRPLPMQEIEVEPTGMTDDTPIQDDGTSTPQLTYVPYSSQVFAAASEQKRVLFFHAAWCPTCKTAHADFEANASNLPAGVVVLKTDYDTETVLKQKYGITYQHTFVQVDQMGELVTKWNGGGVQAVAANLK